MKVIVLGNGIHTKKRIVPALNKIEIIDSLTIADRRVVEDIKLSKSEQIVNYERELNTNNYYDLAIIATPPYNHIDSFLRIKDKSEIALIEKPLTNDFKFIFSKEMEGYLKSNKILESLMYFHHPLWREIKNILESKNIVEINTEFSVPHLSQDSYRYSASKGGGSLFDQGIYPISFAQQLINKKYEIKNIETYSEKGFEVDLSGKIVLNIDNKINFKGSWGLGCQYSNFVNLKDSDGNIYEIDFFYSKPDLTNSKILVTKDSSNKELEIGIHDQFQNMYLDAINKNFSAFEYSNFNNLNLRYALLADVRKTIKL